ncbi:MAG: ATP-binding protein [Acetatifactor sp.]
MKNIAGEIVERMHTPDRIAELENQNAILSMLCSDYVAVYRVHFDTGEFEIYKNLNGEDSGTANIIKSRVSYFDTMRYYIDKYVADEDREYVRSRTDRRHVLEKLKKQKNYFIRYRVKENTQGIENFEIHFTDAGREPEEHIITVGFRNVDSIVRKEEEYRLETQHELEETLEGARTGIWTIEAEEGCEPRMFGDKTMRMLLGVDADISPEDCYRSWFSNIEPDYVEVVQEAVEEMKEKGRSEVIYPWNHPTLGKIYVRCGGVPDEKYQKSGFRLKGYHQDITETMVTRKKQEKALMEALVEAKRANLSKTEFLSHMSHDIRTPINGILGMLAISEKNADDPVRQKECREKIRTAAEHLLSLINDVLDISKLESGSFAFEKEPFDIEDVLDSCMGILGPQAEEQRIMLEAKRIDLTHVKLIGSPLHLRQILINIIGNSIKYNHPGGRIFVSTEEITGEWPEGLAVEPKARKHMGVYRFVVEDTGIGMSPEFQKHLFEPFTQEHSDARTSYKGTGLGMAITKNLVEQMGGTISVESEQGKGSTFTVVLPLLLDKEGKQGEVSQKEEAPADVSGMRVLLVEDNELNREIAQYMLEDAGVTVVNAENGQVAVDAFAASKPEEFDCILMDVMMPVLNGMEATRAIRKMDREDAKTVPIIALSANAFAEDVQKAQEAGMNNYLTKPLDMKKMFQTMASYRRDT